MSNNKTGYRDALVFWIAVAFILALFVPPIFNFFTANRDVNFIVGGH